MVNEMRMVLALALLVTLLILPSRARAGDVPTLAIEAKIPLGDIKGRIDHLDYDAARQRLYVAELGNNSIGIVDLPTRRLIKTVRGFKEPQGIGYEPSTDTVYVASGGDGSLRLFRGEDFAPISTIALGTDADNVRIDLATRRVYAGYGNGAIAIIDAVTRKRVSDISLGGHPESFRLESAGPRLFVNIPDAGAIQVASRTTAKPIASWPTAELHANYPLAIDDSRHRLLTVFRQPPRLEAFDPATGSRLGGVESCGDADDLFIDSGRDRVYVICGEGTVDTYAPAGETFTRIGRYATSRGSRTGLYLPESDRLAVAIRASGNEPAAVWLLRPIS
jgi:DNA-binding beta-propeller fold protein YncE